MSKLYFALLATLLFSSPAAIAQDFAIVGGKTITNQDNNIIEDGVVIIQDGKITSVGSRGKTDIPAGISVIDAKGKWVTPGIFTPFSRVGLVEVSLEKSTNDTRAKDSPFSAALQAFDGFNPKSENIAITRIEGVTRMAVLPAASSTIFAGSGALADTSGSFSSISRTPAFMYVQMGEAGASIAGGSRSAAWTWLRQALGEAKTWRRGREPAEPLLTAADALAIQDAMADDLPFLIAVERASDLMTLIALKSEFRDLNVVAVGASEGWMVASELAKADIPVILDPHRNLPQGFQSLGATMYNAVRLQKAGVRIAIATLSDEAFNSRLVLQHAGNTLATGMDWNHAFAAITSEPARIFGKEKTWGKLKPGMIGDVVIWDGDPLELMSSPDMVFIAGEKQDMTSRQTRLRDRYLSIGDDNPLPYGYR